MAKAPKKTTKTKALPKIVVEIHPDIYYSVVGRLHDIRRDFSYFIYNLQEELKVTKNRKEKEAIREDIEIYKKNLETLQKLQDDLHAQYQKVVFDALGD